MDYIIVENNNGSKEKMEVVTIYDKSDSDYHYIIYKSLINNEYFVGKYLGEDIVDLDTNLNRQELEYANGIIGALVGD